MKNKRTRIFLFSVGLFGADYAPFSTFFDFAIISLWNLFNKISGARIMIFGSQIVSKL